MTPGLIDDATRKRAAGRGGFLPGIVLGLVFGLCVIFISGQETRFAVYGLGALLALAVLPPKIGRAHV